MTSLDSHRLSSTVNSGWAKSKNRLKSLISSVYVNITYHIVYSDSRKLQLFSSNFVISKKYMCWFVYSIKSIFNFSFVSLYIFFLLNQSIIPFGVCWSRSFHLLKLDHNTGMNFKKIKKSNLLLVSVDIHLDSYQIHP